MPAILMNLVFFIMLSLANGGVQNYSVVALEALRGTDTPFDPRIHEVRGQAGQQANCKRGHGLNESRSRSNRHQPRYGAGYAAQRARLAIAHTLCQHPSDGRGRRADEEVGDVVGQRDARSAGQV